MSRPEQAVCAIINDTGTVVAKACMGDDAAGFARLLAKVWDTARGPTLMDIETDHGLLVTVLRATASTIYVITPLSASRYRNRHQVSGCEVRCRGRQRYWPTSCAPTQPAVTDLTRAELARNELGKQHGAQYSAQ